MSKTTDIVFLLDVDNTVLDTDRFLLDLRNYLARELTPESLQQYWAIFAAQRKLCHSIRAPGALRTSTRAHTRLSRSGLKH